MSAVSQLRRAIAKDDCLSKAQKMGYDDDTAQKICDSISEDGKSLALMDKALGRKQNVKPSNKDQGMVGARAFFSSQHPKVVDQCVKMKMKVDDSLSEEDATQQCEDSLNKAAAAFSNRQKQNKNSIGPGDDEETESPEEEAQEGPEEEQQEQNQAQGTEARVDMGNEGPTFGDDPNLPDLDDNDHIDTHMSNPQSQAGEELSDTQPELGEDEDATGEMAKDDIQNVGKTSSQTVAPGFRGPIIGGQDRSGSNSNSDSDTVQPFESNGRFFVKAFLMDTSVNANKWGVSPGTLDANITSYVGKPVVLTENFDHPDSGDPSLDHALLYQELYRIGHVVDVVKSGSRYDAVCEITDPYSIDAWRQGDIPLYVSPQLYKEDPKEPDSAISRWQGTHLALVRDPAYGVKVATYRGTCTGDHGTCLAYLKKASIIEKHGYGSCGYCNRKLLLSAKALPVQNTVPDKPPKVNIPLPGDDATSTTPSNHTSLDSISAKKPRNDLPEITSTKSSSAVAEIESAQKKIANLEQKLAIAMKANEEKDTVNSDLAQRMAALERENRRDKVAAILSAADIQDGFDERLDSLTKSNLPIEEIHSIYRPYVESKLKGASATTTTEQAAKQATKVTPTPTPTSKLSVKNASATAGAPAANQKPAWLVNRDYLLTGVG